ncbi:MAG: ABC transporter permease subunit, partial [Acidimicrobiia bacterium]|nr:ABC transporter permease subunit [Acidimicrobiia bacterium]
FLLPRLTPGEPCSAILGERATPAACEQLYEVNGLDRPIHIQLTSYIGNVLTGDFGDSIKFNRPVTEILLERLPVTVELGMSALFLAILVGIPLGILAARYHNTGIDVGTMAFANIGVSMPIFWLGLILAYFFAIVLQGTPFALPPSGRFSAGLTPAPFYEVWGVTLAETGFVRTAADFIADLGVFNALISAQWTSAVDAIKHLILPAVALSTIPMAVIARMTRSSLLDVLGKDYVRTARAKGAIGGRVIRHHALRNALLPVVTVIGLQLGALLGGAVLTETIFGLAGIGTALFDAISVRDFPIIQSFTVVVASTYVVINLLVDLSYGLLDPRVRLR